MMCCRMQGTNGETEGTEGGHKRETGEREREINGWVCRDLCAAVNV